MILRRALPGCEGTGRVGPLGSIPALRSPGSSGGLSRSPSPLAPAGAAVAAGRSDLGSAAMTATCPCAPTSHSAPSPPLLCFLRGPTGGRTHTPSGAAPRHAARHARQAAPGSSRTAPHPAPPRAQVPLAVRAQPALPAAAPARCGQASKAGTRDWRGGGGGWASRGAPKGPSCGASALGPVKPAAPCSRE